MPGQVPLVVGDQLQPTPRRIPSVLMTMRRSRGAPDPASHTYIGDKPYEQMPGRRWPKGYGLVDLERSFNQEKAISS